MTKNKGFISILVLGIIALATLSVSAYLNSEQSLNLGAGTGTITALPQLIISKDEGTNLTTRTSSLDFVGAGVSATNSGGAVTVTVSGGGGGGHTIQDEATPLTARANLNFVGAGVTVTDGGAGPDSTIVTIAGGGGSLILDLADDAANESAGLSEIATSGDTNTIFSEPTADKLLITLSNDWPKADVSDLVTFADAGGDTTTFVALGIDATGNLSPRTDAGLTYQATTNALTTTTFIGALTGNADTATALAGNPADCGANQFAISIVASGALTCASITDADVPNTITIDLATLATTGTVSDAGGDTTTFPMLAIDATGSLGSRTDVGLTFNATTDALTATTFIGALTGNASTATALTADPADCGANTFADAINASGTLTCNAVVSADITDGVILATDLSFDNVLVDGDVVVYDSTGTNFEGLTCAEITGSAGLCDGVDADSGGSTAWDAIGDPTTSATVAFGGFTETISGNTNDVTAIDQDLLLLSFTNDAATDILSQRGLFIQNEASTNGMEAFIALNNNDADDVVVSGLIINSLAGGITTALDVSDADIVTALSVGANDIVGTTGLINYTNFDVDASGNVTGLVFTGNTGFSPDANDGAYLGQAGTAFSDLFLAEGGVINWDSSDATFTQTGNVVALAGADLQIATAGVGTNADSVPTLSSTNTLTNKTLTSPAINTATLGGHQTMAENAAILYDPTLSADGTYNGDVWAGTAGATLAFGDLVYLDPTDSRWELVDANSASAADGDARGILGICVLAAAADGNATVILLKGMVRADAVFPAMTINSPIYVSETAGDVTGTQPTTTDVVIKIIGQAVTADVLFFNPDNVWITHI